MNQLILSKPTYTTNTHCGYCTNNTSSTTGTSIYNTTTRQYSQFINMGYRRSGTYLYKPDLLHTCCKLYTIRTCRDSLVVSKEHRKCVNRFVKEIAVVIQQPEKKSKKAVKFTLDKLVGVERETTNFRTVFEKASYSDAKYELYKKYQVGVHGDTPAEVTRSGFKRFLCDSPFVSATSTTKYSWELLNNWRNTDFDNISARDIDQIHNLGAVHECYYLNNTLIAISVVDFLPTGVSSVYFIWDPTYHHLSLGTLSAIRDVLLVEKLKFQYYYLGYYVENCVKMKYKRKFGGEVLDICRGVYVPFDNVDTLISDGHFFVGSHSASNGGTINELEMTNFGAPSVDRTQIMDISAKIYNANTYGKADITSHKLSTMGIQLQPHHTLPNTFPGIIPLWQMKEMVVNGEMSLLQFRVFDSSSSRGGGGGGTSIERWDNVDNDTKTVVFELVRLFGVAHVNGCTVVV